MIQFNLLPDVKLDYIKAKKTQRLVLMVSIVVTGVSVGLMILLFATVQIFQKQHIKHLSDDIATDSQTLKNTPQLDKILTVQNQLSSLSCSNEDLVAGKPCLHDRKPAVTRLFDYLPKVTPAKVTMQKLDIDFEQHKLTISGAADQLSTVNKFVDTLKFTTYTSQDVTSETKAFSSIVLSNFGLNPKEKDKNKQAQYQVDLNFDIKLFDNSETIKLTVPSTITTRSETEKPTDIFQPTSSQLNQPGN